jgi:hypothetical protein
MRRRDAAVFRRQLTVMVNSNFLLPPLARQALHGHDRQQASGFCRSPIKGIAATVAADIDMLQRQAAPPGQTALGLCSTIVGSVTSAMRGESRRKVERRSAGQSRRYRTSRYAGE